MSRRRIGKIVGGALIAGALLVGLLGCTRLHELFVGPVERGPAVTLEAVPISVLAGEPVTFYVSAHAREGRKIEAFILTFYYGAEFKSERMAVLSIERQEIVHVYTLPDGVDAMIHPAKLVVCDEASNCNSDEVRITVGRGQP